MLGEAVAVYFIVTRKLLLFTLAVSGLQFCGVMQQKGIISVTDGLQVIVPCLEE